MWVGKDPCATDTTASTSPEQPTAATREKVHPRQNQHTRASARELEEEVVSAEHLHPMGMDTTASKAAHGAPKSGGSGVGTQLGSGAGRMVALIGYALMGKVEDATFPAGNCW